MEISSRWFDYLHICDLVVVVGVGNLNLDGKKKMLVQVNRINKHTIRTLIWKEACWITKWVPIGLFVYIVAGTLLITWHCGPVDCL